MRVCVCVCARAPVYCGGHVLRVGVFGVEVVVVADATVRCSVVEDV